MKRVNMRRAARCGHSQTNGPHCSHETCYNSHQKCESMHPGEGRHSNTPTVQEDKS